MCELSTKRDVLSLNDESLKDLNLDSSSSSHSIKELRGMSKDDISKILKAPVELNFTVKYYLDMGNKDDFKDIELKWTSKWKGNPNSKIKYDIVDDWYVSMIAVNPLTAN